MYRVKGVDQKEYGPVSAEQLVQWIQEVRLNRYSLVQKEGDPSWRPLEQFPEFAQALGTLPPPSSSATPPPVPTTDPRGNSGTPAPADPVARQTQPVYTPVSDPERASRLVKAPAILLILVSLAGILMTIAGLAAKPRLAEALPQLIRELQVTLPPDALRQLDEQIGKGLGLSDYFQAGLALLAYALVMVGAVKMMRLENFGFALTAAILAMLPCSCCCCVGIPIGIWAAIVLSRPEVKAAFR